MTEKEHEFWIFLDLLVAQHPVVIDRPKGSYHPEHPQILYEVDYGYLEGTSSPDGEDVDVWIGSSGEKTVVGIIATVDLAKHDTEIKLLLGCNAEEMNIIDAFYGKWGMQRGIIIRREDQPC
jgi:inorganic pyrophosphatase